MHFGIAFALTLAYVAFGVYVSQSWRAELESAIGPVMSWVIPTTLAYIPGLLIGFLAFTLITSRYRPPDLEPPTGPWPAGRWPAVTLIVAARNEEDAIVPTLERLADLSYPGPLEIVLADNGSTDRTAERAHAAALRLGLRYRRIFESTPGKHRALNTALTTVTTPLVVTVDADTLLHREALTRLVARVTAVPRISTFALARERSWPATGRPTSSPGCRAGTTGWASTGSSACRPRTTARSLLKARSRRTGPMTSERWVAGRTRSARTSS